MTINTIESHQRLEEIAKLLSQNNRYKVLERFEKLAQYHPYDEEDKLIGVYLDTETTGLDYKKDKIIELALVPFEYSKDGRIFKILDSYSSFQDPGESLNEQISLLTGITDDMVKGQIIDSRRVESIIQSASLIVAHNSGFDRKFIEKQFPIFEQKPWGCSYTQVPWRQENIASSKLEYLAYKFGFFYDAHRAEMDCLVGVHILTQTLPISKDLAFKALLNNALQKSYIIWAVNAPFSSKDILKARGYKWNDGNNRKPKAWYIEVVDDQARDLEQEFLSQNIYLNGVIGSIIPSIEEVNALNRFSGR